MATFARFSLSASAIAFGTALATPAYAQADAQPQAGPVDCAAIADEAQRTACVNTQTQATTPTTAAPADAGGIVVTGTRIRRPNLQSPVPITSIGQNELTNQGQVSIGDALNDLPALRSTFSQQNSGRFIGTAGQNFLDLRGLGTNRTLVLVNGRRHVNSSPGSFDVDVDNIPQDLVDRVDVVTGGESAVYGSDAIAGVVNFVLKKNYDGFRIRGQAGVSKYGDRPVDFVSTTMGHNFGDGRGNIAVNLEYTHAGEVFFRDRARASRVCGFEPNEAPGVDDPTVPDNVFRCGIRNPFITIGGQIGLLSGDGTGLTFDNSGNLVITDPAQESFIDNNGTVISDDPLIGATLRETGDLAVGRDRYMANLLFHYDFSDAFQPFVEASFIHQKVKQESQPSFFQGFLEDFFGPSPNDGQPLVPGLRCDNPFLTSQALGTLQAFGLCGDPPGGETFFLNRFNVDFGGRKELDKRDTYRIVAGVQGTFNKDWHYEVSANYGHFKSNLIAKNDLLLHDADGNRAGFALAIDAVRDPNTGQIVCRINSTDLGQDPGGAANNDPNCVPINVFGFGAPSQAAVAYSNTTSHLFSKSSQTDVVGFVSGNSGGFALPGGPIGFSLGAEYRRETAHQIADPVSASGGTFFNAFPEFDPPSFTVKELFGEVEFPILKDHPFAKELTVSGAARFSDYNTSANHTFAWNANAIYAPVPGVRLRANYSRSVRVPTLGDLFTPPTVNFEQIADPCDQGNINDNPNRAANCAALGVPTTVQLGSPCVSALHPVGSPFVNCIANSQTTLITSQGNPDLKEEVGKSLTVGGVLTPSFLPGFSFSVDYFSIKVTSLIAVLSGQATVDQCVDQPTINNQFCSFLFPRTAFGLFPSPALVSKGVNFAKQTSRGIDFDASYRHRFANGIRFDTRAIATYTLERNNFVDPEDPTFVDRQLSELGDPVFSGTLITGIGIGKFDLRHTMRYIGSMTDFDYEDTHSNNGGPPNNPDVADRIRTGAVMYHDIRVGFTLPHYNFYLGVDNVFNKHPPLGLTGAGEGSGIYSGIGRFFYAGAVIDLNQLPF